MAAAEHLSRRVASRQPKAGETCAERGCQTDAGRGAPGVLAGAVPSAPDAARSARPGRQARNWRPRSVPGRA